VKSEAAFRHRITQEVRCTGCFHDISEINNLEEWEEGFVIDGAFKTRQEALNGLHQHRHERPSRTPQGD
jgi:hypothetical protein